jgi:hypothetical protein
MATTRFNANILAAARRLNDPRTDASSVGDTGKRYTSALLTDYQNRVVLEIVQQSIKEFESSPGLVLVLFPEYAKQSGVLTLVSNAVAKPSDAIAITELMKSDGTIYFTPIKQDEVQAIITGADGLNVPSATHPVYWEENGQIKTLPSAVAAWTVIARYIQAPDELAVIVGTASVGKWSTSTGGWTAATRRLVMAAMSTNFAATDVGKRLMIRSATATYEGIMSAYVGVLTVELIGDALPTGDIASPGVIQALMTDVGSVSDLKINRIWDPIIVDKMVEMGLQDAGKWSK